MAHSVMSIGSGIVQRTRESLRANEVGSIIVDRGIDGPGERLPFRRSRLVRRGRADSPTPKAMKSFPVSPLPRGGRNGTLFDDPGVSQIFFGFRKKISSSYTNVCIFPHRLESSSIRRDVVRRSGNRITQSARINAPNEVRQLQFHIPQRDPATPNL